MTSGYQPFTIANMQTGLEQDIDSFLIAEDAFPVLENSYLWRGVVYKKGGNDLFGRLGVRNPILVLARGAGNTIVAVNLPGAPIEPGSIVVSDGTTFFTDNGIGGFVITGGTGTVNVPTNYATGAIDITFTTANPGATIRARYFVVVNANSPVMGIKLRDQVDIDEGVAFDMTQANRFDVVNRRYDNISFYKNTSIPFPPNGLPVTWTGTNSDFFDVENYQLAMFATNNVPGIHAYAISAITQAATALVTTTTNHTLLAGDVVYFNNVVGMTQINNLSGTVMAPIGANTFTVNINTGAFTAYVSGGIVWVPSRSISGDGIRWYDGTGWVNFTPPTDASGTPNLVQGALLLFSYKGYFVLLSTWESTFGTAPVNFTKRARYSQIGNIFYETAPAPLPAGNTSVPTGMEWYQIPGRGGFIDAPTGEDIIAAEFIKDTLVVYFESSIYRLTYTGNSVLPFIWEKVNTEVGSESTFSLVPFDRQILSVGTNGIYACDSVNVERKDRIIPDIVFSFHNGNQGAKRVQGIRDFYSEMVYWTYADDDENPIFPNRILAYNYLTSSFAVFKNYYTSFGYSNVPAEQTWGNSTSEFQTYNRSWGSFSLQTSFPIILAGNQQGYIFNLQQSDGSYNTVNGPSLSITAITNAVPSVFTSINHNLVTGDFIRIVEGTQVPSLANQIFKVLTTPTANTFTLVDANNLPVQNINYTVPTSKIVIVDNFDILTKNLNPFYTQGRSMRLGHADFYFDVAPTCIVTVNLYQNDNHALPIETHQIDLNDVYDLENDKFWRRVYFQSQGQFLSMEVKFSDNTITNQTPVVGQMFNLNYTASQVVLHGIILWMRPAGRLLTNR